MYKVGDKVLVRAIVTHDDGGTLPYRLSILTHSKPVDWARESHIAGPDVPAEIDIRSWGTLWRWCQNHGMKCRANNDGYSDVLEFAKTLHNRAEAAEKTVRENATDPFKSVNSEYWRERALKAESKVRELTADKPGPVADKPGPVADKPGPVADKFEAPLPAPAIKPGDWVAFSPDYGPVVYGQVTHLVGTDAIYTSAGMVFRGRVLEVRRA